MPRGENVMEAIAICGSPREGANTETLLKKCLSTLESGGIAGELVRLGEYKIDPCNACRKCFKHRDNKCVLDDDFHKVFAKMLEADIIIVGSPVYYGSATPETMALLDRAGYVARANGDLFSRKLGGPVAVARRAGQNFTYAQLMFWFMINGMVVPGSTYWNIGFGGDVGKVNEDTEAIELAKKLSD
jgi:multimeric flavodoxin WrbA